MSTRKDAMQSLKYAIGAVVMISPKDEADEAFLAEIRNELVDLTVRFHDHIKAMKSA